LLLSFVGNGGYLTNPSSAVAIELKLIIKKAKIAPVKQVTCFKKRHRLVSRTKLTFVERKHPFHNRHFSYEV
jgi:hypothetical protein